MHARTHTHTHTHTFTLTLLEHTPNHTFIPPPPNTHTHTTLTLMCMHKPIQSALRLLMCKSPWISFDHLSCSKACMLRVRLIFTEHLRQNGSRLCRGNFIRPRSCFSRMAGMTVLSFSSNNCNNDICFRKFYFLVRV